MELSEFSRRIPPSLRTIPELLKRQAEVFSERPLFITEGRTLRFSDAPELAACAAGLLAQAGIRQGDRVAFLCANRWDLLRLILGCAWLGAIAVPINVASRGMQLRHILHNCGPKLLVAEASLGPTVAQIDPAVRPGLIWFIDPVEPELRGQGVPLPEPPAPVPATTVRPGDPLLIVYTSGTTGPSKGVACPHAQLFWWAAHTADVLRLVDGDVLHTALPLFHVNALNTFVQALLTGGTMVLDRRFSVSGMWSSLRASGATVTYLLGAMVPMLLSREPSAEERSHTVRTALAPGVPAAFHRAVKERFGFEVVEGYGSTETNFVIAAEPGLDHIGTMGRLRPGFSAQVVDDDDNPVPDGEAGELLLRADEPFAFASGYFGMAESTVAAWRNLWFHTGDRVTRDSAGRYTFVDRLKDAIRRRGENISSFEVEQVLMTHPAIASSAVFPVRSELAEDEVMAAVVLKEEGALTGEELVRFCEPRMPYYAVPRFIEFMRALPMTENGKIQKFALRNRGVTPATWDREAAGIRLAR